MGDIWKPHALWDSPYLWMPLEIGNGSMQLPAPKAWQVHAVTGATTVQYRR
jgi:hypothetical protein